MFIESIYYDNGLVKVRLHKNACPEFEKDSDLYDHYIDHIGYNGDYESVDDWIDDLEIEFDDITTLLLNLESGAWCDISNYC